MGLDMSYAIDMISAEDVALLKGKLEKIGGDNLDITTGDNFVSVYYRLNWSGVRYENEFFIYQWLANNIPSQKAESSTALTVDQPMLVVNRTKGEANITDKNKFVTVKEASPTDNFDFYTLEYVKKFVKEHSDEIPVVSPIGLITMGKWYGSNGENISLYKRSAYKKTLKLISNKKGKKALQYIDRKELAIYSSAVGENGDKSFDLMELQDVSKNTFSIIDLAFEKNPSNHIAVHSKAIKTMINFFIEVEPKYERIALCAYMG